MHNRFVKVLVTVVTAASLLSANAAAAARPSAGSGPQAQTILQQTGDAFIHLAQSPAPSKFSELDDLALNHNFQMGALVVNQINAYNTGTPRDDHPLGLLYSGDEHWTIYNEDNAAIPANAAFNVFVPPQDLTLISHVSAAGNTLGSRTFISATYFNDSPDAFIFATHVTASPSLPVDAPSGGQILTTTFGVSYDAGRGRWAIMTADGSPMPLNEAFFVLRATSDETALKHTASAANHLQADGTAIDDPAANGHPDAMVFVTQNMGTSVTSPGQPASNHRAGVQYSAGSGRWLIVNEDAAAMANGVSYNVLVIPPTTGFLLQTATPSNTIGFATRIDNPDLNFNPYARLFVSRNYNPPEDNGNHVFDDHPVSVGYNGIGWSIYNQDSYTMPVGANFNVYYTLPRGNSFDVSASTFNSSGSVLTLTHPLLDQHPDAVAIATANNNPNNALGASLFFINVHSFGLYFDTPSQKWTLSSDTGPTIPISTSYNLLLPPPSSSLVVTSTGTLPDTDGAYLYLDSPLTNGNPWAMVFATPRNNVGIDEHNLGVSYDTTRHQWAIFNEDEASNILSEQAFNVFVVARHFVWLPLMRR